MHKEYLMVGMLALIAAFEIEWLLTQSTTANLANANNTLSAIPCNPVPNLHLEGVVWSIDDCVILSYNKSRRSKHNRFASPKTSNPV